MIHKMETIRPDWVWRMQVEGGALYLTTDAMCFVPLVNTSAPPEHVGEQAGEFYIRHAGETFALPRETIEEIIAWYCEQGAP